MKFNSFDYFLLVVITLVLFFNLPRRGRLVLLIGSSLLFYAFWSVPLTSLIVVSAVVDFTAGWSIGKTEIQWKRRTWLLLSLCVNLGLLGYFKYANFFIENVQAVVGNESADRYLEILLPPGISFYTFQTMSYTIDVYRRNITATSSFLRFFLYVSFFPQLVAGPIERAAHLLTQFDLASRSRFSVENFVVGSRMIVLGLFKKMVIADYMAQIVDHVYASPESFDGWGSLVATYAFTLQIYCDFSAYSEIARGSARLFGIDLIQNFDQPYLTTNISDFWRRWHISLSTWIRDYIYLPLGGSRGGARRTLINLIITMFLSGLWHGAAWNFVLWGFFHGVLLVMTNVGGDARVVQALRTRLGRAWTFTAWFVTFQLVAVGWILFRVDNISDFPVILFGIATALSSFESPTLAQGQFLAFMVLFLAASYVVRYFRVLDYVDKHDSLAAVFYAVVVTVTLLFGAEDGPQFIYFQF